MNVLSYSRVTSGIAPLRHVELHGPTLYTMALRSIRMCPPPVSAGGGHDCRTLRSAVEHWGADGRVLLAIAQRRRVGEHGIGRREIGSGKRCRIRIDRAQERDQIGDRVL